MNILASYNWIKEYLKTDATAEEFAREMSLKSMSVESIDCLKDRFKNIVIGEIKDLKQHPDADRLKIVIVDIGSREIEIVCGGQNLCSGMKVVVALPCSRIRWHGEGDLVELQETKVRGILSYGMICAPSELGFEKVDCKDGDIWDLTNYTQAKPGTSFVEAMDIDDIVFDIEVTSNRVDSMSIVGLAREAGVVLNGAFSFEQPQNIEQGTGKNLDVIVEDADLCPRYMAVVINNIKVGPSPTWLQNKLLLAGHRPINNIVDITNFVLHEYGQPLHAFDYEKVSGNKIIVRRARNGEKINALDGKIYELSSNNLVIADSDKPVAVAGVMGGEDAGTHENTTTIIIEAATFDPVSVRRTSRALNLASDSQLLFEKGLSVESTRIALNRAVELTLEIAGGSVASQVYDIRKQEYKKAVFEWNSQTTRDIIGVEMSDNEMIDILKKLGFDVEGDNGIYQVSVPFWRDHDIESAVDFTEEIARVYGYHNIVSKLPNQEPPRIFSDINLEWEVCTKNVFSSFGYTELYGYSFISAQDFERYDLDPCDAVELYNPLSSDLTHMRVSLIPSCLRDVSLNQGHTQSGKIFELGRVYIKREHDLPDERTRLLLCEFGIEDAQNSFLYQKGALECWANIVGIELSFERISDDVYWHSTRSSAVMYKGNRIGTIGQVADQYMKAFKVEKPVILVDIDFEAIVSDMVIRRKYEPIAEYPVIVRDIAVELDQKQEYVQIEQRLKGIHELLREVSVKDIYQGEKIEKGKKSITLSLTIRSDQRTLSSSEADEVVDKVTRVLIGQFGGKVR
jgi:phenylalanyl-tRNA synthetase beta chain